MRPVLCLLASFAVLFAGAVQADDPLIDGRNASGAPGETVFVELTYDYGASFEAIVEDFSLVYPKRMLSFLPDTSRIGPSGGGAGISLTDYVAQLKAFAVNNGGNALANDDPQGLPEDKGGFKISFFTDGTAGHARSGSVLLRAAFEILPDAPNGNYVVSFGPDNVLVDLDENEFSYPASLQQLQVTVQAAVVPEPAAALMLLPGLALVAVHARRRRMRYVKGN